MTPPDFDELARLWTQEQSPEEQREFQRLARRAGRRAKALEYAEHGMGALLILAVLAAFFLNSEPATLIVGGLTVAAILWAGWRRHHRREAQLIDAGDREAMLDHALRNARARRNRSAAGLALIAPGFLLGALFKYSVQNGGEIGGFLAAFVASVTSVGWGLAGLIVLLLAMAWLLRSHLAIRRELARLEALRAEYREEARLDRQP
jgi:hypothetical protein